MSTSKESLCFRMTARWSFGGLAPMTRPGRPIIVGIDRPFHGPGSDSDTRSAQTRAARTACRKHVLSDPSLRIEAAPGTCVSFGCTMTLQERTPAASVKPTFDFTVHLSFDVCPKLDRVHLAELNVRDLPLGPRRGQRTLLTSMTRGDRRTILAAAGLLGERDAPGSLAAAEARSAEEIESAFPSRCRSIRAFAAFAPHLHRICTGRTHGTAVPEAHLD